MLLILSLALNGVLILALVGLFYGAKNAARKEKLATFAGVLSAMTSALMQETPDHRIGRAAVVLSSIRGGMDTEQIRSRLTKAAYLAWFKSEPVLADIGGETVRLRTLEALVISSTYDNAAFAYIANAAADEAEYRGEPSAVFGNNTLATSQFHMESEIVSMYGATLAGDRFKLF
jgi:hypothetical protein